MAGNFAFGILILTPSQTPSPSQTQHYKWPVIYLKAESQKLKALDELTTYQKINSEWHYDYGDQQIGYR